MWLLLLRRGGGSIADLSCFDSQLIAEKIAASKFPVLSGIGHGINITITDLAAHTYAKTPTAIAQFLVDRVRQFGDILDEKLNRIQNLADDHLRTERQRLKDLAGMAQRQTLRYVKGHGAKVMHLMEVFKDRPFFLLKDCQKTLQRIQVDFLKTLQARLSDEHLKIKNCRKIVDVAHPVNTLKRGFTITRTKDGSL